LGKLKKIASQTSHKRSLDENFKTKTSQKFAVERERERERERESAAAVGAEKRLEYQLTS
jgi:hypothetical protein